MPIVKHSVLYADAPPVSSKEMCKCLPSALTSRLSAASFHAAHDHEGFKGALLSSVVPKNVSGANMHKDLLMGL